MLTTIGSSALITKTDGSLMPHLLLNTFCCLSKAVSYSNLLVSSVATTICFMSVICFSPLCSIVIVLNLGNSLLNLLNHKVFYRLLMATAYLWTEYLKMFSLITITI